MAYSLLIPTAAFALLLFVFAPAPSVASVILDSDGDIVRNGGSYYILPDLLGTGGLTVDTSAPCPLYISQKLYSKGSPVRISSLYRTVHLTTWYPIIFSFDGVTATCNKPLRWWVAPKDAKDVAYVLVGTDGPFKNTYFFKINEAKKGAFGKFVYNIKFCRSVDSAILRASSTEECDDVTFIDDNLSVVPNAPYPVYFVKADPQVTSTVDRFGAY